MSLIGRQDVIFPLHVLTQTCGIQYRTMLHVSLLTLLPSNGD